LFQFVLSWPLSSFVGLCLSRRSSPCHFSPLSSLVALSFALLSSFFTLCFFLLVAFSGRRWSHVWQARRVLIGWFTGAETGSTDTSASGHSPSDHQDPSAWTSRGSKNHNHSSRDRRLSWECPRGHHCQQHCCFPSLASGDDRDPKPFGQSESSEDNRPLLKR